MKKYFIVIACVLFMASCGGNTAEKISEFVDKTEKKCESFNEKDWEKNQKEFDDLINDYKENYDEYTEEEHNAVGKAIGKYTRLSMQKAINDIDNKITPAVNGFLEGLTGEDEE